MKDIINKNLEKYIGFHITDRFNDRLIKACESMLKKSQLDMKITPVGQCYDLYIPCKLFIGRFKTEYEAERMKNTILQIINL